MTTLNEVPRPFEAVISEAPGYRSRDEITVAISQTLLANQVIGRIAVGVATAAVAAVGTNTGNGVLTMAGTPGVAGCQAGVYRVVIVEPGTNLGTFLVEDPTGRIVDRGFVGTAFSNQIAFTLADGATDFVSGDSFNITITGGPTAGQWGTYDPAATDGRQVPAGVLCFPVTTGGSVTAKSTAIVRAAELNRQKLQWLTGLTTNQRNAAIALFNAPSTPHGLLVR